MIWPFVAYPVAGLVLALVLSWIDYGPWDDGALAGMIVIGCLLFWPIVLVGFGFKAVHTLGDDYRRRSRNRFYERERQQREIDETLRREGIHVGGYGGGMTD